MEPAFHTPKPKDEGDLPLFKIRKDRFHQPDLDLDDRHPAPYTPSSDPSPARVPGDRHGGTP